MSAASSSRSRGKLAVKFSILMFLASAVASALITIVVIQTLGAGLAGGGRDLLGRAWALGLLLAVVLGIGVGVFAYVQAGAIASRVTDLGLAVAKLGRGTSEVRVRYRGHDEVAALGRALQYLASDLAAMAKEAEEGGGLIATTDRQVRAMRDLALPNELPALPGYEVDGALSPGSRGGMDYFDGATAKDFGVLFLVSNEGAGALSVLAARLAHDEVARALVQGASARRALAHCNRVLHKKLPRGVCAKACLLELHPDQAKLYQAGYRAPALVCARGQVEEHVAEGLALGLDEGPVFEKGLRSKTIPITGGVRIVLTNEAGMHQDGLVDLVEKHSPKHTAAFMNMVLGNLEAGAGEGGLREDVVFVTAKKMA